LNSFLFVYEEKRRIGLVIVIIASILVVISSAFLFGVITYRKEEVFNGTLKDNEIFLIYWENVFAIKVQFLFLEN
jgi:hypothetical protein